MTVLPEAIGEDPNEMPSTRSNSSGSSLSAICS